MAISQVFDRVIASETERLGSVRYGQLSATFGLSGNKDALGLVSSEHMDIILTSDRRHLPVISKDDYAEIGQRIFDSSISLCYLTFPNGSAWFNSNSLTYAEILSKIYEDVLKVVVPVGDIVQQLGKLRGRNL